MICQKQYKNVIWDWNGTLFDDAWLCLRLSSEQLVKRGLPAIDAETHQRLFTHPVKKFYEAVGIDFSQHSFEELASEFFAQYQRLNHQCSVRSQARKVLAELQNRGVSQSVLSASDPPADRAPEVKLNRRWETHRRGMPPQL